jgi:hypothetical protein
LEFRGGFRHRRGLLVFFGFSSAFASSAFSESVSSAPLGATGTQSVGLFLFRRTRLKGQLPRAGYLARAIVAASFLQSLRRIAPPGRG